MIDFNFTSWQARLEALGWNGPAAGLSLQGACLWLKCLMNQDLHWHKNVQRVLPQQMKRVKASRYGGKAGGPVDRGT